MKIVIEAKGIKREIDGPFAICMSREDFSDLQRSVRNWLEADDSAASYGWCEIVNRPTRAPNGSKPMPWVE